MRPVFCGNLDYDTRQSELDRLFSRYGRIDRIDMKSGTTTSHLLPRRKLSCQHVSSFQLMLCILHFLHMIINFSSPALFTVAIAPA